MNGFGKYSGPTGPPMASPPFGYLSRSPSPPPPPSFSAPPRHPSPWPVHSSSKFDDHGSPSAVMSFAALHDNAVDLPQDLKGNRVPHLISTGEEHLQRPGTHIGRPVLPLPVSGTNSNFPNKFPHPLTQQNLPLVSTRFREDSGRNSDAKHVDIQLPKRTRSPPLPSTTESSIGDSFSGKNDSRRPSLSPPGLSAWPSSGFGTFDSQSHRSPPSAHINNNEVAETKPKDFPVPKRSRLPSPSSDPVFHVSSYSGEDDTERELQAKAKRLARFKDELSQSEESNPGTRNQKLPSKKLDQSMVENRKSIVEPLDMAGDFRSGNLSADYESLDSSSVIIGYCPDMCPEPERAERERKGDLDQYERLDGDRNQTSISLAVKKYNRTAEREADLIRPMPILQKTMSYLLNLLDQPYDDRLLGLYNFLWDRMRAIRMDLRMQHIFNLGAITMLEQMIRLHILAMHELCQYARGEGFSEGFDAHLNIEQMNKTSVELFQLYDDHRKKGTNVPTEKEFRGYYALLKLDKHPGYKVEPAELSLDLAKMTPEIRQTSEILFARDVARSCRAGNFIAFFRLARKASYLQACLMHAHFGKLRSQALASLHSGLQNNQGIPVSQVSKWLGMEEENIEDLLEYHGFLIKEFEEPYMVKEGPFMNGDNEYPLKRSKLVDMKKSNKIVEDVSSPSLMETLFSEDVKRSHVDKANVQGASPVRFKDTENPSRAIDYEMPIYEALSSPKNDMQMKPRSKNLASDIWRDEQDNMDVPSPSLGDISKTTLSSPASMTIDVTKPNYDTRFRNSLERSVHTNMNAVICTQTIESPKAMITDVRKPNYDTRFRNSIEKNVQPNADLTSSKAMPITLEPEGLPDSQMHSSIEDSVEQPVSVKDFGPEQHRSMLQEVESHEVDTIDFDEEIALAKLKLILRIWRRRSSKKKEVREQRQLAANAALSKLSLGAPLWQYKEQPSKPGEFNIDRALNERCKKQEQSWSTLNVSKVVADKLSQLNPCSGCLCWKIIFCSLDEVDGDKIEQRGRISYSDATPWLRSKLMPDGIGSIDDLLVSSPGLTIWKNWVYSQSIGDLTCCLSVIKETEFDNLGETLAGASSILFLVSGCIPWAIQRARLHNLTMAIPSGAHLPLLILSGWGKNDSDFSTIAINLGLDEVDKSRISTYSVVPLVKEQQQLTHLDTFFSDEQLRKGLQWLASESPLQPRVHDVKTRELVLAHFNRLASVLEQFDAYDISPNHCISAINGALDQSIEEISNAAKSNPTCWPCPEISLLEESCEERRAIESYLPEVGWSSDARMEKLISTLDSCRLPSIVNETSWRWTGANMGIDIENQKLDLEDFLIKYLTESTRLMEFPLAQKEASIMLQKCTTLKLRDMSYHILPNWYMIFRRVFNWQLMNLSDGVLATSYVMEQDIASFVNSSGGNKLELEGVISTPYNLISPSLDEMVEVSCSSDLEYIQPLLPMVHHAPEVQRIVDENHSVEEERFLWEDSTFTGTQDNAATNGASNTGNELSASPKIRNETDRLSWLLEQCNLVQNMNQKKLSLYF